MNPVRILGFAGIALAIAGCAGEPTCDYSDAPYMAAKSVAPLQAPEGLTAPDRSGALVVPPAPPNAQLPSGKGRCLDRPPSYFSTQSNNVGGNAAAEKK